MKKLYTLLIIILLFIIALLVLFMVVVIKNNGFYTNYNYDIIKEEKYSISNIDNMHFDFISSNVNIYNSEDEFIHIVQYGNEKTKQFNINIDNNYLKLDSNEKNHFIFNLFNRNSIFDIYIPSNYCENMNVETVSGDISIEKDICSVSLKTISGNIKTENIDGDTIIKTTSGDINIGEINGNTNIKSISGEIYVSSLIGNLEIKTTSSDVKIDYFSINGNSNITSISGNIEVIIDKEKPIKINYDTVSGNTKISDQLKTYDDSYPLNLKTISGNIKID